METELNFPLFSATVCGVGTGCRNSLPHLVQASSPSLSSKANFGIRKTEFLKKYKLDFEPHLI